MHENNETMEKHAACFGPGNNGLKEHFTTGSGQIYGSVLSACDKVRDMSLPIRLTGINTSNVMCVSGTVIDYALALSKYLWTDRQTHLVIY